RVWRRLLENSLSAKVSCWLIRLLILGSGYNTMISHLGLIRTFPKVPVSLIVESENFSGRRRLKNSLDENLVFCTFMIVTLLLLSTITFVCIN
ncbi:hypothetical protein, partial [Morganella morganii]|uniref:hypothetical protein n=1 Tax=Morganella morganii TaxID=582 RepID=UPI003EB8C861